MKRKLLYGAGGLSFAFIGLWYVLPALLPWSAVNCWHYDVDIAGGRARYQRYLLWLRIIDRVEDTRLSRQYGEVIGALPEPEWRRAGTRSPMKKASPKYAHSRSLRAAEALTAALDGGLLTDAAKKQALLTFFDLLQKDEAYSRAAVYAQTVWETASERKQADGGPLDVAQLPEVDRLGQPRPEGSPTPEEGGGGD